MILKDFYYVKQCIAVARKIAYIFLERRNPHIRVLGRSHKVLVEVVEYVRIINPSLVKCLLDKLFPNIGTLIKYLGPLVQLGPLVLMGTHVPVSGVWGTLLEVNCHLLYGHASVWAPPRPIPTFLEQLGVPIPTSFS